MELIVPKVVRLIQEINKNEIWQYFSEENTLTNPQIVSINPFVIECNGINYLITSNSTDNNLEIYEHVLLATKKPTRQDLSANSIIIKRWLKHPDFVSRTPEEVVNSWRSKFHFIKENVDAGVRGLRPPQIGALYSILAHIQNSDDKAIIVMPTGTGKTETMLSVLIANECKKLLVSVPSDSLRTQISNKFITLGLLKEYGIVDSDCFNPIVGVIRTGFTTSEELTEFISKCNVVVSTMDIFTDCSDPQKIILRDSFSHFFVDEAHHSEARTWKELIDRFEKEKVFLFTATPFRNDGKTLQGKEIFNFSLRKAQEQRYYKEIKFIPIREYNKALADEKIADKAVAQLKEDISAGYNHILMARCMGKARANEVFAHYEKYPEHNPVVIYNGVKGLNNRIEAIKRGEHSIIVCVNMLGEGFDLPNLKIAAIHDERQSLPITLQFIGRFTRTSYDVLGTASFITNTAYPPIHEELEQLYARNADWNLLLPRLSENATQREINIRQFLQDFHNLDEAQIPFAQINPAMSTVIYKATRNVWNPANWQAGFPGIDTYEHVFSDTNHTNTLVIILGKIERVEWGSFETVQNLEWDMVVIHWDLRPDSNRVFLNTSIKAFGADSLMDAIFDEGTTSLIRGMNVFRIFHNVNRLSLYNVGARRGIGRDITFQSYYGSGVQDGIREIEQGTLIKNNIFGVGYKEGEKVSLGCSVKGKIWSYQRGNLDELTRWCRQIGEIIENDGIDPNIVLRHTLAIEKISVRPNVMPIYIDWHPSMYESNENHFRFQMNGMFYDLSNVELALSNPTIDGDLNFSLDTENHSIQFGLQLRTNTETGEAEFEIMKMNAIECTVLYGNKNIAIKDFFQLKTPIIWFADGSQLLQNLYVRLRENPGVISNDNIIVEDWTGVNIARESQDIAPYVQDSIQYHFINKINNDFDIIYDDDGKGEIADIIGINNSADVIDVHLYHLKYARGGEVTNNIDNFYQVCGQAQKSLKWKHKDGREFFNHLFRRITKTLNENTCSRIIKGSENDLEMMMEEAKYLKPMRYSIYIVQPSLSKAAASDDILLLLGNTSHYLATVGNVDLKVYTSQ